MLCSVTEHIMTSLSFQIAVQKIEVTMSCFAVWKRNGVIPCSITEQTVLEHGHIQSDVITCTTGCDNVWLEQWEITATMF